MLRSYGNVLQFWGIGQGQVCMSERLVMLPRHEIEAVPLVKAGKAQNSGHTLELIRDERADDEGLAPR
ncbi:MAG: hypothetical protein ACLQAN_07750 [Acidimicrobiales bacterium]